MSSHRVNKRLAGPRLPLAVLEARFLAAIVVKHEFIAFRLRTKFKQLVNDPEFDVLWHV
jgi:hypothetical protein